jgi:hypothetical protein
MPPGHVPDYVEDTEMFEVSPTAELNEAIEVVATSARQLDPPRPGRAVTRCR